MSTLYFIGIFMYTAPRVSHIRNRNAFLQQGIDQRHRYMRLLRHHDTRNMTNRLARHLLIPTIKNQPAMILNRFRFLRHHINDTHRYPSPERFFSIAPLCHKKKRPFEKNAPKNKKIPQAVWIACNFLGRMFDGSELGGSIPQAVWIACNIN